MSLHKVTIPIHITTTEMFNQHLKDVTLTQTKQKHKDLSHLRQHSPGMWVNTKYINSTMCQCDVFQVLINSLVCWFCTGTLHLTLFQIRNAHTATTITIKKKTPNTWNKGKQQRKERGKTFSSCWPEFVVSLVFVGGDVKLCDFPGLCDSLQALQHKQSKL